MEKRIPGFEDYAITSDGKVISYKTGIPKVMKTWYQNGDRGVKKAGYENIKLCKNNKKYHFLIHRLVAEAFIPNPQNLPEVNHKNKNRQDNRLENLEWCTRIQNLYDSYDTMPPIRNFVKCSLYRKSDNCFIKNFNSIREAGQYVQDSLGESQSSLIKYLKTKNYYLKTIKCND